VQEMSDLTQLAFELADKYRIPVFILSDGATGQMMEPVEFPDKGTAPPHKDWAIGVGEEPCKNLLASIFLDGDQLEAHNLHLEKKYAEIEANEIRYEEYKTEDADVVTVGFGVVARILRSAIDMLRKEGLKVGLLRPITLWPFPNARLGEFADADQIRKFITVEMNHGQMVKDVKLAINGKKPVEFYGRMGGNIPTVTEVAEAIKRLA